MPEAESGQLSSAQYLTASAEASTSACQYHPPVYAYVVRHDNLGAVTALLTNPIWVVKVRMFTTPPDAPNAYRGLIRTYIAHTTAWLLSSLSSLQCRRTELDRADRRNRWVV